MEIGWILRGLCQRSHREGKMKRAIILCGFLTLVMGCESDESFVGGEDAVNVVSGPAEDATVAGIDEIEEDRSKAESDASEECDDFFCVDAGTFEEEETPEEEGGDEKGDDNKEGGEKGGAPSLEQCIDDCVAKGETEEDCGPLCEAYLSGEFGQGGKEEGGGEGEGGKESSGNFNQCLSDCLASGETEEVCTAQCEGAGSGGEDGKDEGEGDEKGGGGGNSEVGTLEECIEGCIAKGTTQGECEAVCAELTGTEVDDSGKDDESEMGDGGEEEMDTACYDACVDKGESEEFCSSYCSGSTDGK